MTLKNLLCVAIAATLMTSQALAQQTAQDPSNGGEGPEISIDLLRGPGGNPVLENNGLVYVISVMPDQDQPVFTPAGDGPNGEGASVGLELGFTVGGAGLASGTLSTTELPVGANDPVTVNLDNTPGVGTSEMDPGNTAGGFVEFANPGNSIFGFEVANLTTTEGTQIGGVQIDGNNVFAALGTTFFAEDGAGNLNGPYEILRIKTGPLDADIPDTLMPSLTLVANSIAAQSIDLSDAANPDSQQFFLPETTDSDLIRAGDTDLDGDIDITDFSVFGGGAFDTSTTGGWAVGDFDNDGDIDITDFSAFGGGAFDTSITAPIVVATTEIPEPTSVIMSMIVAAAGLATRRQVR